MLHATVVRQSLSHVMVNFFLNDVNIVVVVVVVAVVVVVVVVVVVAVFVTATSSAVIFVCFRRSLFDSEHCLP